MREASSYTLEAPDWTEDAQEWMEEAPGWTSKAPSWTSEDSPWMLDPPAWMEDGSHPRLDRLDTDSPWLTRYVFQPLMTLTLANVGANFSAALCLC